MKYDGSNQLLIVDDRGNLVYTIIKKVNLSKSKIKEILDFLSNSTSFGGEAATCFESHLGFVFYEKDKPLEHVSICLVCNGLNSSLPLAGE